MKKVKIQIIGDGNMILNKGLKEFHKELLDDSLERFRSANPDTEVEFVSCFLPPHIVESNGFSLVVDEILSSVPNHVYALEGCKDMADYTSSLVEIRKVVADEVDYVWCLAHNIAFGTGIEINLASKDKIVILSKDVEFERKVG